MMRRAETRLRVWLMPVLIGLLSAGGLVTALLDDGVGEIFSWIALGLPVLISFWYLAGLNISRTQGHVVTPPAGSTNPMAQTDKATGQA